MEFKFFILTFMLIINSMLLFLYKEHKKTLLLFFVLISTQFYTPVLYYYILKGKAYVSFQPEDLENFINICTGVYVLFFCFVLLKNNTRRIAVKVSNIRSGCLDRIYMLLIGGGIFIYIGIFFFSFPLVQAVVNRVLIERPDVGGYLPHYYVCSTFMYFIVPALYFYICETFSPNRVQKVFLLGLTTLILVIGGNKGVLVYLYLFIWMYEWKGKINLKMIALFSVSLLFYFILKDGMNRGIGEILLSAIRRFFVTQGAMFINRLAMKREGFVFGDIANDVYSYVYEENGGSAPTFFLGDFMIRYPDYVAWMLFLLVMAGLMAMAKQIDAARKRKLYMLWGYFSLVYVWGMGGITRGSLFRCGAIALNLLILFILDRDRAG